MKLSVGDLDATAETLLIPLSARVLAPELNPDLGFRDPMAEALFERLDADPRRFAGDRASMRGSIVRARWFDRIVSDFLLRHSDGLIVSMGSGLDARAQRLGYAPEGEGRWCDIDMAPVVALRHSLLAPVNGVADLTADLNDVSWLARLPWQAGQPALFLAEGVTMYLEPQGAEGLIRAIGDAADERHSPIELAFDYASPWMVRNARRHPSVRKTGAVFRWALGRPGDLLKIDAQLRVGQQIDITAASGFVPALMGKIHRVITGREIYACLSLSRPTKP